MKKPTRLRVSSGKTIFTLAMVIGLAGTLAGTAQADNRGNREGRDWNGHAREAHNWHRHHIHHGHPVWYGQQDPYVVYAPPVVEEAPPEEPGVNFIIPLNFN